MNIIFQVKHVVLFWFGNKPFQNSQIQTHNENNGKKFLAAFIHVYSFCNIEMNKKQTK